MLPNQKRVSTNEMILEEMYRLMLRKFAFFDDSRRLFRSRENTGMAHSSVLLGGSNSGLEVVHLLQATDFMTDNP